MTTPDDILPTYEEVATQWDAGRAGSTWEAALLKDLGAGLRRPTVLDLGCGSGRPIACHLAASGAKVTAVDGAAAMVDLCRQAVPEAQVIHADMRSLDLGESFDIIIAFDSFFHLDPAAQRAMFPIFKAHAHKGTRLLLTTGSEAGVRIGSVAGRPVYHASLAPEDYRSLMDAAGFDVDWFRPEDPQFHGRSVWRATAR